MRGLRDKEKEMKKITAKVLLNLKKPVDQIAPSFPLASRTEMFAASSHVLGLWGEMGRNKIYKHLREDGM